MIILIAVASVTIAFFGTRALLGDPTDPLQKAPKIEKIDSAVNPPDPAVFNDQAINPAVEVQIQGTSQ